MGKTHRYDPTELPEQRRKPRRGRQRVQDELDELFLELAPRGVRAPQITVR